MVLLSRKQQGQIINFQKLLTHDQIPLGKCCWRISYSVFVILLRFILRLLLRNFIIILRATLIKKETIKRREILNKLSSLVSRMRNRENHVLELFLCIIWLDLNRWDTSILSLFHIAMLPDIVNSLQMKVDSMTVVKSQIEYVFSYS